MIGHLQPNTPPPYCLLNFRNHAKKDSHLAADRLLLVMIKALFRYIQKPKTLQDSPSHRILRHMHEILNVDKKNN